MITIDGDFENASLGQVARIADNWYHVGLRPDTWYWTHFRVRGCKNKEITFTLTYADVPFSNRWGTVETGDPERPDMRCRNPYLSYDGVRWEHFSFASRFVSMPRSVCFRHTFKEDEAFVSYTIPYTYSNLRKYLKRIENHPRVAVESLGRTANGNDLPLVTVQGNDSAGELIVLICREDSDEPTSNNALEGLINRLMAGGADLDTMLDRCVFKIVPMVAIDAVMAGTPYGGPWDVMARRWLDDPPLPEIAHIKSALKEWFGAYRIRLIGKVHGGQTYDNPPIWDFRVFDLDLRKLIPEQLPQDLDTVWNPYLVNTVPWVRQLPIFESYLQKEYEFWHFFSTHTNGRDPENLREQGGRFAELLAQFIQMKSGD